MNIELILTIGGIALTVIFGIVGILFAKKVRKSNKKSFNKITQNGNFVLGGDIVAGDKNVKANSAKK